MCFGLETTVYCDWCTTICATACVRSERWRFVWVSSSSASCDMWNMIWKAISVTQLLIWINYFIEHTQIDWNYSYNQSTEYRRLWFWFDFRATTFDGDEEAVQELEFTFWSFEYHFSSVVPTWPIDPSLMKNNGPITHLGIVEDQFKHHFVGTQFINETFHLTKLNETWRRSVEKINILLSNESELKCFISNGSDVRCVSIEAGEIPEQKLFPSKFIVHTAMPHVILRDIKFISIDTTTHYTQSLSVPLTNLWRRKKNSTQLKPIKNHHKYSLSSHSIINKYETIHDD